MRAFQLDNLNENDVQGVTYIQCYRIYSYKIKIIQFFLQILLRLAYFLMSLVLAKSEKTFCY